MPTSILSPSRMKVLWVLILAFTVFIYADTLKNGFVLDDSVVIVRNDFIKHWENLPKIFTKSYLTTASLWGSAGSGEITYRPLLTLTFFLDYHLWKLRPAGYHLTNLLLELLAVWVMLLLARAVLKSGPAALLAALFFAVHPAASETVAVITNRKDILAFILYAVSFLFFLKDRGEGGKRARRFSFLSLLAFFLALLTKEMAVTLPFALMLYDASFTYAGDRKTFFRQWLRRYGGYFLVLALYASVWLGFRGGLGDFGRSFTYPGGTFYTNLCTMTRVIATYLEWLFFPLRIHATLFGPEAFPASRSFLEPGVLGAAVLILAFLVTALGLRKRAPAVSFSIFCFFLSLTPVLNLVPLPMFIACRYLYLPLAFFALGLAAVLTGLPSLGGRYVSAVFLKRLVTLFVVLLVAAYARITMARVPVWDDNFSLSLEHVKNYPSLPLTHINLAKEFRNRGLMGDAIRECKAAIALDPMRPEGYNDLGATLLAAGQPGEAVGPLKKALAIKPDFLFPYCNLGLSYKAMGRWDDSQRAWREAARLAPQNPSIRAALQEAEARR